jgi:hypothetical protein
MMKKLSCFLLAVLLYSCDKDKAAPALPMGCEEMELSNYRRILWRRADEWRMLGGRWGVDRYFQQSGLHNHARESRIK